MNTSATSHANALPDITVTKWDRNTLDELLSRHAGTWSWRAVEFLVRELLRAHVADEAQTPSDVVTMRSQVKYRQDGSETNHVITLVYPGELDFFDDALSVLTPVGAALIGLSEGQTITYPAPAGGIRTLTVVKVLSQPERSHGIDNESVRRKPKARSSWALPGGLAVTGVSKRDPS